MCSSNAHMAFSSAFLGKESVINARPADQNKQVDNSLKDFTPSGLFLQISLVVLVLFDSSPRQPAHGLLFRLRPPTSSSIVLYTMHIFYEKKAGANHTSETRRLQFRQGGPSWPCPPASRERARAGGVGSHQSGVVLTTFPQAENFHRLGHQSH